MRHRSGILDTGGGVLVIRWQGAGCGGVFVLTEGVSVTGNTGNGRNVGPTVSFVLP